MALRRNPLARNPREGVLQYIKKESKFGIILVLLSADGSGRQRLNNAIIAKLMLKNRFLGLLDVLNAISSTLLK